MAKMCLKKTSKRVSCRTRYKVEHKVREHNRKKRRQAKKDPFHKGRSAEKKVIRVPNICPFKDDILKEAAEMKQRKEDARLAQQEVWRLQREEAKTKGVTVADLLAKAEADAQALKPQPMKPDFVEKGYNLDGSAKAYYREFRKVVELSDVILEVVDARDPLGTRCPQVEQAVLDAPGNKRLVIVINKADLVSRENLDQWLLYLRQSFPTTIMKANTQKQKRNLKRQRFRPLAPVSGKNCVGASLLMSLLANYCRNKDIKTAITVGVVGLPNVGKSSIINSLNRQQSCGVGATPGITRRMQEVTLDCKIKLLDSPGVVLSRDPDESSRALRNVVSAAAVTDPLTPAFAILARADKQQMCDLYGIPAYETPTEFLHLLAKRSGRQKKGGVPNVDSAARTILTDWNSGRIKYHTVPPENAPTHVSAEIVKAMADEFTYDATEESDALRIFQKNAEKLKLEKSTLLDATPMEMPIKPNDVLPPALAVGVTGGKRKKGVDPPTKPDRKPILPGNQKLNHAKKMAFKKQKKEKARVIRRTDDLVSTLESFSFTPTNANDVRMDSTETPAFPTPVISAASYSGDSYDFNSDYGT